MTAPSTEIESETEAPPASHAIFEAPDLHEVAGLFPSYDIYSLIACGGMGAVYHGNQRSLDRHVAIKILPRAFSNDPEFRVIFEAEAKAMAKLNHPNLIGVYDFGEVEGLLYIIMEYVPGSSLYQVSHGRVVHQDDALKMVISVCRGLAHAHEHGILHRDIKPSNILMDTNATAKIGDFGLASNLGKQVQEGEQIFGTPGYTAPEVIEPPHIFDHRADIFSIGVMLHEMLTGITPNGVDPIAPLPPGTNPKLRTIIQRASNPNPAARHTSADELAAELEKVAATPYNPLLATTSVNVRATSSVKVRATAQNPMLGTASVHARAISPQGPVLVTGATQGRALRRTAPRHRMVAKNSSSGSVTFLLMLILLAVAAAIYIFIIKPSMEPASSEAPPPSSKSTPNPYGTLNVR